VLTLPVDISDLCTTVIFYGRFATPSHFPALVGSRTTMQTGLAKFDCISVYSGAQLVGCSVYYDWKAG